VRRFRTPLLIGAGVCALSVALYVLTFLTWTPALRLLNEMEARTLDMRFRIRGPRKPSPNIVIVAIDQKSEDLLGRWPFPRTVFAQALDFLRDASARVVAVDIGFEELDEKSALKTLHDLKRRAAATGIGKLNLEFAAQLDRTGTGADNGRQLSEAIARFGNTILGYWFLFNRSDAQGQDPQDLAEFLQFLSFRAYPRALQPRGGNAQFEGIEAVGLFPVAPSFAENAKNFGFCNVITDTDLRVRHEPAVIRYQDRYYPSFGIATALAWTNEPLNEVALVFNAYGVAGLNLGSTIVPTDPWGMVGVDFHGPAGTYPTYSIADLVLSKAPREAFRDRIVLIGPTATGIRDVRPSPFDNVFPGIEVHANFVDNLLAGSFIRRGQRENFIDMLFLVLFSLPVGVIVSALRPLRSALLLTVVAASFLLYVQHAFSAHGLWYAVFLPMATLFATYSMVVSYSLISEKRGKRLDQDALKH
jgi:adenylate cyclase